MCQNNKKNFFCESFVLIEQVFLVFAYGACGGVIEIKPRTNADSNILAFVDKNEATINTSGNCAFYWWCGANICLISVCLSLTRQSWPIS